MKKMYTYPSLLTVAGTDPTGGAGIQADLKTFAALGCYGMSVVTALVAQNTCGVREIHSIPPDFVRAQLLAVLEDIRPDAIKIGMVHSVELVNVIADVLKEYQDIPVIFDPVMISTSGHRLIEKDTIEAIKTKLFPLAALITPNMDEASLLAGMQVKTLQDMQTATVAIMDMKPGALLLKGGHLQSDIITSILVNQVGFIKTFESQKIITNNMHGSGCTLSSAIASFMARGYSLEDAVANAQEYVHNAILYAADAVCGKGNGPLNHSYNPQKMIKNEMV
ncbi:bifunctional hydroxymethylpyrimidine kinase/phosphomethylpyrimidine kinase [Flavobacterium sp. DG1-102-2]|uniref:bifunctional hydroxymethylpyrimidine kinase/phosphomethylpyrimidine kinase n=1 Tax=Flavobacterium sp. DG1-102-2 TaxID=3081663 RepID=UPI00294A004C|nr:bifunctional hydroxymethylpyrimidine kinase/phosphomethylpyrimidine kinase [Flavobacterium sp. DG1-102-2]MDV6168783.1 bifunctional hydroxymethylpyrimidine kinase/phosphomethylpyrimidine kinase [Flavobacterium sp. DG1-102-2]